jgi:chemotaxis signal transduction protein
VVPVLDPRPLLGLSGGGMSDLAQAIVFGGAEAPFALAVERVEGRVEVPRADGGTPPPGPFLRVAADGLALLDVARLVAALPRGR